MSSGSKYAGLPEVHHVGLVVADLNQSIDRLSRSFGVGPFWSRQRADLPAALADGTVGFSLGVGMVWMYNTLLELLQPLDDRSPIHAFLRDRGEGLHHLAFWVDGLADHIAHFESLGLTRIADNTSPGPGRVSWAYLEGDAVSGTVLELMNRDESSEVFFNEIYRAVGRP